MRRLVFVAVVVIGLLVALDRVAVGAAERAVARQVQVDQDLTARPGVSIGGFPFLTQAVAGRYDDVTITMHDLHRTRVRVDSLTMHLHGVHAGLGAALSQHLSAVHVDRATATLVVSYADLDAFLGDRHLQVSDGGGGEVKVSGSATVAGQTISASARGRIDVRGSNVVVTVGQGLDFTVPLGGMPFSIKLLVANATKTGIEVTATATDVVLHPRE